jgi:hypothetical protein
MMCPVNQYIRSSGVMRLDPQWTRSEGDLRPMTKSQEVIETWFSIEMDGSLELPHSLNLAYDCSVP